MAPGGASLIAQNVSHFGWINSGGARVMSNVARIARITRTMVRENPDVIFVFGDNMEGRGMGGQAREMRGEPNAVGIPTKWRPGREERDYFTDRDIKERDVWYAIHEAFQKIREGLRDGKRIVIPLDGIGTGLAELPTRAPKLHLMIEDALVSLENTP